MAEKVKQMHWKKILLVGGILMVALVAGLCVQKPEGTKPTPTPLQPSEELKLSDFPDAFKDSTLIIVGDDASDIEMQAANEIADYLENETGNKPLIKKHSEISDEDKRNYNLIVVGTPKTNLFLEEVYAMTNATRVTEEFPGEGKGVLEILRNPWDESKAMLLVEGWDERGVKSAHILTTKIHLNEDTTVLKNKGRVEIWTDKMKYEKGEPVKIYIWNGLNHGIYIYPFWFNVEKLENNKWRNYSTVGPYFKVEPPRDFIPPNNVMEITWNLFYYGLDKDNFGKKYDAREVGGRYRLLFNFWKDPCDLPVGSVYSNEFQIGRG